MPDETPVACRLSTQELRNREATLLAQFKTGLISIQEIADGYLFRIREDKEWIAIAGELMATERECCPFLTFELAVQPQMGPVTLRMTGPPGTKEFLKSILI